MKKLVDWLLFGKKKKEDYLDLIIIRVKKITKLANDIDETLAKLQTESDVMLFNAALNDVKRLKGYRESLVDFLKLYPSMSKYVNEEVAEKIEHYERTLQLLCYGAKFDGNERRK